ncbi:MAG: monovalent cation/H(+) antiporter subunit G [Candidatus Nanopelagicales bacterium]|jgi:multicomponent Na+:H+ antiporter subunit G|nr:monovalent cation/H(+) antiporter subunit G [Candidatus Nanopelagicales bacterium]
MSAGEDLVDLLAMGLLVLGSLFSLTAAIGLLRFPDVLSRLHAATKPQVLGVLLVILAIGLRVGASLDLGLLVLAGTCQLLTLPVAAHMVGRAVYRADPVAPQHLAIDDLGDRSPRDG